MKKNDDLHDYFENIKINPKNITVIIKMQLYF